MKENEINLITGANQLKSLYDKKRKKAKTAQKASYYNGIQDGISIFIGCLMNHDEDELKLSMNGFIDYEEDPKYSKKEMNCWNYFNKGDFANFKFEDVWTLTEKGQTVRDKMAITATGEYIFAKANASGYHVLAWKKIDPENEKKIDEIQETHAAAELASQIDQLNKVASDAEIKFNNNLEDTEIEPSVDGKKDNIPTEEKTIKHRFWDDDGNPYFEDEEVLDDDTDKEKTWNISDFEMETEIIPETDDEGTEIELEEEILDVYIPEEENKGREKGSLISKLKQQVVHEPPYAQKASPGYPMPGKKNFSDKVSELFSDNEDNKKFDDLFNG